MEILTREQALDIAKSKIESRIEKNIREITSYITRQAQSGNKCLEYELDLEYEDEKRVEEIFAKRGFHTKIGKNGIFSILYISWAEENPFIQETVGEQEDSLWKQIKEFLYDSF